MSQLSIAISRIESIKGNTFVITRAEADALIDAISRRDEIIKSLMKEIHELEQNNDRSKV